METSSPAELTPRHVRAARALLAWSQQDLARAASVGTSTIADFERGHRTPVANNAQAIRDALERAGISFLETGAVIGPPIRGIAGSGQPSAPVRWVTSEDLGQWADRLESASDLPTLIAGLIQATQGSTVELRFPGDEGVRHPGWDGYSKADEMSRYVPEGVAGWEIGVQRNNVAQKAEADYAKRTQDPGHIDPANATYIFVTPRRWSDKDKWAADRRAAGPWRDVRVYDGEDLVHWIEQTPAIGHRLATQLRKQPPGTLQLDEMWNEWSLATEWPLSEDLVLADRDEDVAEILRWLRGEPSTFSIKATTRDEAAAFFHATLSQLPKSLADHYRAHCLVALDASAARALGNAPAPLIIVMLEPEPGIARSLVERGHFVLQTYDDSPVTQGEFRALARPSREGIAQALTEMGIADARADALARDSARNLAVLRRLIPSAPGRLPLWATQAPPRALLAALLAGGWDEDSDTDKAQLAVLADTPYERIAAVLTDYVGDFDRPLRKVGSLWRVASPSDSWMLLASYFTSQDIKRFEAVALNVLGATDPRFNIDPDERWRASFLGVRPSYSGMLRHGIGEVLILLALRSTSLKMVADADQYAVSIVRTLLRKANEERWWSLSNDLRLLAEAAPDAFLSAVEDSLSEDVPALQILFKEDGGSFGGEHLSDLLWALESLAWSPTHHTRVSLVLARLDSRDSGGRYSNRPAGSLRLAHLLWAPQTRATLEQRMQTLDLIRKYESDAAWKLMLAILPSGHDSYSPSAAPRWRDFGAGEAEPVTWEQVRRGAAEVLRRLKEDVGLSAKRWQNLFDIFSELGPERAAFIEQLSLIEPQINSDHDRDALWSGLRALLHHHRQFPDADWSLPATELDRLEEIYDRFEPGDPLKRIAWLFKMHVVLPKASAGGWEAEERHVDATRVGAARSIFESQGVAGVLALAREVEAPGFLGKALVDAGTPQDALDDVLETSLRSMDGKERDVAHGIIVSVSRGRDESWAEALFLRAEKGQWGSSALISILRALPQARSTWNQATRAGPEIEHQYWTGASVFWISEEVEDVAYAIRKLLEVGRAHHAIHLAGRSHKLGLPSDLIIRLLQEAVRQPFDNAEDGNERTMFQHHVGQILTDLDARDDVSEEAIAALEWAYLPILQYSRRPAKMLPKLLSEQPGIFVDMVKAVFRPSEDSGVEEPPPEDPDKARSIAQQAYSLLTQWKRLPGTREDGSIDGDALEVWIKRARALSKEAGRLDIADGRIGEILSASPEGADGVWPAEPVRHVIDLFRSASMLEGFWIGRRNRRGVTTRGMRDGGAQERALAGRYQRWADAVAFEFPYTAKALRELAESYERDAKRHDEEVERLEWN